MYPNQISEWKQQLTASAFDLFDGTAWAKTAEPDLKMLLANLGEEHAGAAMPDRVADTLDGVLPAILNTDQNCQFTRLEFTGVLKGHSIQISLDGKGCWRDNVFVEWLWKSVKYKEVYLYAYDSMNEAKRGLGRYVMLCNQKPEGAWKL